MLADFNYIPINTTAEKLERIANLTIIEENSDEIVDDNSIFTSLATQKTIEKITSDVYSNSLKGKIYGKSVLATDVSPVKHTLDIKLEGKNIFEIGKIEEYENNFINNFEIFDTEINAIGGTVSESAISYCYKLKNYDSGIYTFSYYKATEKPNLLIRCFDFNGTQLDNNSLSLPLTYNTFYKGWIIDKTIQTINIPNSVAYWQIGVSFGGIAGEYCTATNILVERGETSGEFVPAIIDFSSVEVTVTDGVEVQKNNANIDGTVENLQSYFPYMEISTNNDDVFINCTYNRDINKISGNVDLSNYYTKTEIDNKFDEIETAFSDIETLLGGI